MKKINHSLLASVSGAAVDPANQEVIKQMTTNMAYGAGWGAITGGAPGALVGATGGALQTVIQGAINHGPVNVPIPKVPMGPVWIYGPAPLDWINQNVPK
ncbi:microcin [Mixta hanseatica]|uniref:Microcin n=1 Tax=Mixta hanseatica TaxID=2872648 RepID=A0ABY4RE44_9GAMM|nr:microcin [Mixta hanseatica]UQY45011.1 microcin [Mixta hanseatica]